MGDVIRFNMLSVENKEQSRGKLDPHFSGRYIIESMRHRVTNNEYIQVIECAKDSVVNSYSKYKRDTFPGSRLPYEKGSSVNLAYLDDIGTMDGY